MKLFGNSSGKHVAPRGEARARSAPVPEEDFDFPVPAEAPAPRPAPAARPEPKPEPEPKPAVKLEPKSEPKPEPAPAPRPERTARTESEPRVQFVAVEPEPEPEVSVTGFDSDEPERETADREPKQKRKNRFRTGYLIYLFVFLFLIAGALFAFHYWLDNYEQSRPHLTMEHYLRDATPEYWHEFLSAKGVEESFLETLDLSDTSYFKKMDRYTDEAPAYGIRFGDRNMLITTLKRGRELSFGQTAWDVDTVELVKSKVSVYVPAGAVLTVRGEPVSRELLVKENALALSLGELEQSRTDIPGLDQYEIGYIYGNENLVVRDAEGEVLPLSERRGFSYYYAPFTHGCSVTAPSEATVRINGVVLTAENSTVETGYLEDFEDVKEYLSELPGVTRYTVDGLVAEPVVEAEIAAGTLSMRREDDRWTFEKGEDPAFAEEQDGLIRKVLDAYCAFLGNRGKEYNTNLTRYRSYLLPGSVAWERSGITLDSLTWVTNRDQYENVSVGPVLQYGDDCFTALVSYSAPNVDGALGDNTVLMIFLRHEGEWKVAEILNKSSVV